MKRTMMVAIGVAAGLAAGGGAYGWHQHKEAERAQIRAMFQASLPPDPPFRYDAPAPAPDHDQAKRLMKAMKED